MFFVFVITTNLILSIRYDFFYSIDCKIFQRSTDNISLDKIVSDDENNERWLWHCLGQTCSSTLIVSFVPIFCNILDSLRLLLSYTPGQELLLLYSLDGNLVQRSRIHFTFAKLINKVFSTKNRIILVGPGDSGKTYLIHEWLKVGTFQPKFDKNYFFYQRPQPLYGVMQKEIDNLEFVQGVNFEFINSLK